MRRKVLLLLNAAAGTGTARGMVFDLVKYLTLGGLEVTAYPILPENGLTSAAIIRAKHRDYDVIACCGGDGTLNHVVSSIASLGLDIPIGYIPSGSTNDFARSLGIPADPEANCRGICGNNIFAYDIGRFNDRYFNYVAAFGAFTRVSYSTGQSIKNVLGYGAYLLNGILSLPESMSMHSHLILEHDGGTEEGEYVFGSISNTTSVGGMKSALIRKASLNDGLFEVILISAPDSIRELGEIVTTLTSGSVDNKYVRVFRTRSLLIKSPDKAAWTLDGEYGGTPEEIHMEVCPARMKILLPEEVEETMEEQNGQARDKKVLG